MTVLCCSSAQCLDQLHENFQNLRKTLSTREYEIVFWICLEFGILSVKNGFAGLPMCFERLAKSHAKRLCTVQNMFRRTIMGSQKNTPAVILKNDAVFYL